MRTLYIDIETAPQRWWAHRDFAVNPPVAALSAVLSQVSAGPPKNYTNPETIERWKQGQISTLPAKAEKWWRSCSLDPGLGMVVTVGCAVDEDPPFAISGGALGIDEERLLVNLFHAINDFRPNRIVAFNGAAFDFPFLWQRATYWGMPELARWFARVHHGDRIDLQIDRPAVLVDPRKLWHAMPGDWSGKLTTFVEALRLAEGLPSDEMDGSMVLDMLCAGCFQDVARHGICDIEKLRRFWHVVGPSVGAVTRFS